MRWELIGLFVLIFAIGVLLGWLWRSVRRPAREREAEAEHLARLKQQEFELTNLHVAVTAAAAARAAAETSETSLKVRSGELQSELATAERTRDTLQAELSRAQSEVAATRQSLSDQARSHEQYARMLKEQQERALSDLRESFQALSAEALRQSAPEFLRLAGETFGRLQEASKGELSLREEKISSLIKPLEEQLRNYQERLQQAETGQSNALGDVRRHLESLAQNSNQLASETVRLRQILGSNQARGRWGEETLRRVIEAAGLSVHCDFTEQVREGDSKPDLIVRLPGDRIIVVDAKVPDLDFLQTLASVDDQRRGEVLAQHASRMRSTIKALADRDYPRQFPNALDFVVLFLPAESLFSAALEADSDLIVWAAERQILLATPASLIALLRSVSVSWRQHEQSANARQIAVAAQELFARVTVFAGHFEKIRKGLATANEAYDAAVGSYERNVRPSGERLQKLGGASPEKQLGEISPLGSALRLPPETVT